MSTNEANNEGTKIHNAVSTEIEQLLGELWALGRLWARYGLTAGKQALETSARTQEVAARCLGELAERFAIDQPRDAG